MDFSTFPEYSSPKSGEEIQTMADPTAFELFLSDEVQELLDYFAATLDIRVTFFSADGRQLRRGRQMRNSDYCRMVQEELGTLKQCLTMDTDKRNEAVRRHGIIDYNCHAGLREAIAPIFIHDRLAGFLMIGQFRTGDEPPSCLLNRCTTEEQRKRLFYAFTALPRISPEKLESVLGLFRVLLDYIVVRELAVLQGDRLRHDIDRYLKQHCAEEVRLPEMARRLGRSASTISQFLRRNYRTSFKELLIECRLARAEAYWQENPGATVGETAYAAGFRDQFYFSRVFRKRRGIPPGEYRDRLRKTFRTAPWA